MSDFIVPYPDEDSQPFWDAAARGELAMQRCSSCARFRFPPRPMCPQCRSTGSDWPVTSGTGTIWSFAVPHPPLLPAYAAFAPYAVILVALDEDPGLRLVGNLVASETGAINEIDPSTIAIGEHVRVVFQPFAEGIHLPRWMRA